MNLPETGGNPYNALAKGISHLLETIRRQAARSVNVISISGVILAGIWLVCMFHNHRQT